MAARIEYKKREIHVFLDGEIDHHSAFSIKDIIDAQILKVSPRTAVMNFKKPAMLVMDFGNVSFMDSSGIGLVMGRYKLMKTVQGRIRVENLSPGAYRVMKLAGLERLGEIRQKEVV